MSHTFYKKKYFIPLLLTMIFMIRILFFVFSYAGIEHDSGWYLGVAKNLAHRGIYASYTNTIREEGAGAHPSIHGRFSVQDAHGYNYFPAGVTVGPGYIIPEAFMLLLLGDGWWQYRAWPLIAFSCLLFLLFFLVKKLGGFAPLAIFLVWLWVIPQLYIGYSFESFSEDIALLYLLTSFFLIYWSSNKKESNLMILFSGVFFSLSFLTKNLFFLASAAFVVPLIYDFWTGKKQKKKTVLKWAVFLIGFVLPITLYEGYRYLFLVSHFGYSGWDAVNKDISLTFQSGGSGIAGFSLKNINWEFVARKLTIWAEVGILQANFIWIILLLSPILLLKRFEIRDKILFAMIYLTVASSFVWYIFISPTGWGRHAWQGIVLGMVIISLALGQVIKDTTWKKQRNIFLCIFFCAMLLSGLRFEVLEGKFFLNKENINTWRIYQYARGLQGFPSTPLLPLDDQRQLISFFKSNISKNDRVYYAGWFIHPEASTLVDKVFYTLDRYFTLGQRNPDGGKSYIIFGPYQHGQWSLEPPEYLTQKKTELCQNVLFENPSYVLCLLRTGLVYNNPAY